MSTASDVFDALADGYDDDEFHPLVADTLVASLPSGASLLVDVATGTGAAAFAALRLNPASIVAVDFSPAMLALARTKAATLDPAGVISWHEGRAVPLPIADGGADAVVCASALHFLGATALAEWLRVLRPGGVAAFSISSAKRFSRTGSLSDQMPRDFRIPATEADAAALATDAGFGSASATTVTAHLGGRERLVFAVRAVR
ncbi:class I SAM-dependent methyltransferase [Amycolatopsis sp. FDAARGOS 1241]|uniref:class I SAM-dependent methyltransferase n=1 Tax=Amycolatopsis sp. FDAARGOS 1241 TaxID=2778070 RepID=UPI00194EA433|nr:class I SAM-dependent methyltransferase [Amycolatopsis sp. FDAARGOS 1241]QRP45272.1 class I SAM-dependent methyltransferase [Amycolatopsis sp. FDAARGOS 1241]